MQLAPFLEYLQDRAGDSLRAVEWYRADEAELVYLRDDLELADMQARADEIHELVTRERPPYAMPGIQQLGAKLATVNFYEEAVLLNFPLGENYGVVVGLEPGVARSLHGFIDDCRSTLDDEK